MKISNFWKNKVVIITGSGMGIGKNIADQIGLKGGIVVINGLDQNRLNQTHNFLEEQGIIVSSVQGDVSVYENCQEIIDQTLREHGRIDVLVNNAGITGFGQLEEMNPDVFKKIIDVNLIGSFNMTRAALPAIKKSVGNILFVGSLAGIHGIGNHSAYCTSKMALTAMAECLRIELHDTKVNISLAYVGFTENDPKKTFLSKDGTLIHEPERTKTKREPTKKVAGKIIRMIEKKHHKSYFTFLGKLNLIINRISPFVIHKILLNVYKKDQNN